MLNYSFDVTYYDAYGSSTEVVSVKRVVRSNLKDLLLLQQMLLDQFFASGGGIGDILAEEKNWHTLKKTAALLPIVGSDKPLDLERFQDDYVQITRIFFTQSVQDNGEFIPDRTKALEPSLISKLHQFNYNAAVGKALEKLVPTEEEETVPVPA